MLKMIERIGTASWHGDLKSGKGQLSTGSGVLKEVPYEVKTRFGNQLGTNPEELLGAAHAACFSMALSLALTSAGFSVTSITTKDKVLMDKVGEGFQILKIETDTVAIVAGISYDRFQDIVEKVKDNCPVSKALKGVELVVNATLYPSEPKLQVSP
ncbi:MAG: peroxiredoxin OsmC [Promethearchaeota archaeon CR_4]|nr:MAG: peroxiredoxin OsmC [Candidatus Lokiarchaeota archaeon CR_4]